LGQVSTVNFISAGMVVGVIEFLLGVVMIQAPTLAAALTGGAVFQSGVGTVSALLAGRGLRGSAQKRAPAVGANLGGGSAGGGGGRAHAVGAGLGRAGAAAGGAVRRAAYKLASLRSRT
jgi:hypothetical protein